MGISNEIHRGGAPEMGGNSDFSKVCYPHSPWQNKYENRARRVRRRIPKCVWDFHMIWEALIYTRTVHKDHSTPMEVLTGDTVGISEWTGFEFYDLIIYWDDRNSEAGQSIGRWLGLSNHIGSALCYYILTEKATVVSTTTVQHMTKECDKGDARTSQTVS